MKQVKTIGVLTSGGDAPGMNAAIRAVVRAGIGKGMRVLGIRRGYNGLINGDMVEMNLRSVSDILQKGGTILYTARCLEFKEESGIERAKQTCVETGLDGVVVIGGVSWSLYALLGGGTWFQPFLFFVVSVVLGSIVWGISEIINLHAQQIDIQLRLEEKLRKLVPETHAEEKPVEFCAHCGTQLPPGGKTCPSCHEVNQ